ncbi:MAG: hypothetical protein ACO4CP_12130 [Steroidobacteraceae bacterium]
MITFFTVPKRFDGHVGLIQANAIGSWLAACPGAQVILFGEEAGTWDAAAQLGVEHVPEIERTALGAPRVDDVFARVAARARHPILCFANTDVVFRGDVTRIASLVAPFLVVGECIDMDVREPLNFDDPEWRARLPTQGRSRGPLALDYFFFTPGSFGTIPPFALGRARYDNWLVWRGLDRRIDVVDAGELLAAVHQRHDYAHLHGGRSEAYRGADAKRNQSLAGVWCWIHLYSILDATRRLTADGPEPLRRRGRFAAQFALRLAGLWDRFRGRDETLAPGSGGRGKRSR